MCKAKLKISNEIKQFACSNCGNEFVVIRDSGVVYLKSLNENFDNKVILTDNVSSFSDKLNEPFSNEIKFEQEIHFEENLIIKPSISEEGITKINNKIYRLQNHKTTLEKNYKIFNTIVVVGGIILLVIVYLYLPMVATYEELFWELLFSLGPIIIIMVVLILSNRKTVKSNQSFIDEKIQKTINERDTYIGDQSK